MKFMVSDLDRNKLTSYSLDTSIDIHEELRNHPRYLDISLVDVVGSAYYERESSQLIVDLILSGTMKIPCAITLKPIDWDFDIRYAENFSFDKDYAQEFEAVYIPEDELDLKPYIVDAIVAEIPLKMVDPDLEEYPSGDGWSVLSEAMVQKAKEDEIDPRLAILKDFKVE